MNEIEMQNRDTTVNDQVTFNTTQSDQCEQENNTFLVSKLALIIVCFGGYHPDMEENLNGLLPKGPWSKYVWVNRYASFLMVNMSLVAAYLQALFAGILFENDFVDFTRDLSRLILIYTAFFIVIDTYFNKKTRIEFYEKCKKGSLIEHF